MQAHQQIYEFPISANYIRHWGLVEAVRELIQNAIDSESPFEYKWIYDLVHNTNVLKLTSKDSSLSVDTLLLGNTSKADKTDKIGSFGEGYKLALLVLARSEYYIAVYNGKVLWYPTFSHSEVYNADTFKIKEVVNSRKTRGLEFVISGLHNDDVDAIKASCLFMHDQGYGAVHETSKGQILLEQPHKLFVGGLFVCDTELDYGYNVLPQYLRLERDRQTVGTFDLQLLTKEMWLEAPQDEVVALIEKNSPDIQGYIYSYGEQKLADKVYNSFSAKNPDMLVAKDLIEQQALVKLGVSLSNIGIVPQTQYKMISSSPSYNAVKASRMVPAKIPQEILAEWFETNKKHIRPRGLIAFKELFDQAKTWRL